MIAIRLASAVIIFAALIILRELFLSKNGVLRKILIGYFAAEIWIYSVLMYAAVRYIFPNYMVTLILFIIIPKFIAKMAFLWYVLPKESGRKLY